MKDQLLNELEEMRQKFSELETSRIRHRQAEEELRETRDYLENLINYTNAPFIVWDTEFKITRFNHAFERLTGYTSDEIIGQKLDILFSEKSRDESLSKIKRTLSGEYWESEEIPILRQDGDVRVVLWNSANIYAGDGVSLLAIIAQGQDITERKQAEEELRETRDYLENLINYTNAPFIVWDTEFKITRFNHAFERLTGHTSDEIIGQKLDMLFPEKSRDESLSKIKRTLSGEYWESVEIPILRKYGNVRVALWNSANIYAADGTTLLATIAQGQDITERKQTEEELKQSEEKFRSILNSMTDYCYIVSKDFKIEFMNKAIIEKFGDKTGDMCYKSFFDRESPCPWTKLANVQKGEIVRWEHYSSKLNGTFDIIDSPLINKDGTISKLGIWRNITERKQAEEALAAEKERLNVTLRSIGDGVITTNTEGKIVLVNKVAEDLTGWSQQEAMGKYLHEVFNIINEKTRKKCENPVEKVLKIGGIVGLANHTALVARDGTERIIADSGAPIRDKDSKIIGVVLVFRDISEKKKMEEASIRAQKLESIGIFAGGIAHDFNNILTAVLANISLAKMYTKPEEDIFEILIDAEKASVMAKGLNQQLLTFSKGGTPVKKTASLAEVVKNSACLPLRGSNIRCEFSVSDDLWPAEIDEGQISQVINNLILNAEQAMPEGGKIKVCIENATVTSEDILHPEEEKYVKISIHDQGGGIPEEHLQKIFDPYFTTKQKGSGLGLAASYSIIKKHDGLINVESEVGVGTIFYIYLPASEKEILTYDKASNKVLKGKGKILVMDDEALLRDVCGKMLNYLGYEVEVSRNGAETIKLYKKAKKIGHPFDAVIIDLTIPGGMGGKEAIKRLIKIDPEIKAIVSSGYSNDPIMSNYKKYGFKGIIAKPYKIEEMSKILYELTVDVQ